MLQLGLGLGLGKGAFISNLSRLKSKSTMLLDANKADGFTQGINSPATNPMVDLANQVGKNLFNPINVFQGGLNDVDGSIIFIGTRIYSGLHDVVPFKTYTIKVNNTSFKIRSLIYYNDGVYVSTGLGNTQLQEFTFTIPTGATQVRVSFCKNNLSENLTPNDFFVSQTQLELGLVATSYEPYARNDLLLTNFAFTPISGYTTLVAPNGKTVTALKQDGVDDLGILANSADLDVTGTDDFLIARFMKTSTLVTFYPFSKAEQSEATTQYALKIDNTGVLSIIMEGTTIQLATGLLANTFYKIIVYRESGVLKAYVNNTETYNLANVISLTSRPNVRQFALSTNVGGTTHTGFSNEYFLTGGFAKTDVAKAADYFSKYCQQAYGL